MADDDVMAMLDSLISGSACDDHQTTVKRSIPSASASAITPPEDVLSFLDELAATTTTDTARAPTTTALCSTTMPPLVSPPSPTSTATITTTTTSPNVLPPPPTSTTRLQPVDAPIPFNAPPSVPSPLVPPPLQTTTDQALSVPLPAPHPISTTSNIKRHYPAHPTLTQALDLSSTAAQPPPSHPPTQSSSLPWTWDSLLTTARQQVSSLSQQVSHVTESTIKQLSQNDAISKSLAATAGVASLSKDLSRLAQTGLSQVASTLAPPLLSPSDHSLTLWFCFKANDYNVSPLHGFIQDTVNQVWLRSHARICSKAIVNSVKDPHPVIAKDLDHAVTLSKETLCKLQALADQHASLSPSPSLVQSTRHIFLIIQPYIITVPSSARHLLHYIVIYDEDQVVADTISQSVLDKLVNQGDSYIERWLLVQRGRVVEVAIGDLIDEYAVKSLGDNDYAANASAQSPQERKIVSHQHPGISSSSLPLQI
ncbi:hypothetical protein SeMB42_g01619 [Synchytrium endobioticum]|uniref:Uncharacterized protein n=1 Tax=Synchytrium endobioticum TaxID=286115 RepID=A0A507CK15_9FUNG|nr:hypothetical protein SeLEV6574_g06864 [Synchytrium endobioticum]TPX52145.1 hypothetical protein SeMB42_g01619 [Synchytrium endobioticum]